MRGELTQRALQLTFLYTVTMKCAVVFDTPDGSQKLHFSMKTDMC